MKLIPKHVGRKVKTFFQQKRASLLFFALLSIKKYSPVLIVADDAMLAAMLTVSVAAIVVF